MSEHESQRKIHITGSFISRPIELQLNGGLRHLVVGQCGRQMCSFAETRHLKVDPAVIRVTWRKVDEGGIFYDIHVTD